MRAVNLLPPNRSGTTSRSGLPSSIALPAIGVVTTAVIAGLVVAVWTSNSSVSSKQQQLNAIQSKIAKLPTPAPAASAAASAAPSRKSTVTSLAGARLPWDRFLGTFSRVVPENVWLSSMNANAPGAAAIVAASAAASTAGGAAPAAPAAGASNFTITGFTYSQPSVARLMRRLALIPWLTDVALVTSSKTTVGTATVFQFTLGATIVPQPGGDIVTLISKIQTSPRNLAIAIVCLLLVLTAATWFILVSPKQNQASGLSSQIQTARATLHARQSAARQTHTRLSQGLFIRRALPDTEATPQVVLELSRLAGDDHVSLDTITPGAPTTYSGFNAFPISIDVSGRFFNVEAFLHDLRNQVTVSKQGVISSTGRLFDVQSVNLTAANQGPGVSATIALDVFDYSAVPVGGAPTGATT